MSPGAKFWDIIACHLHRPHITYAKPWLAGAFTAFFYIVFLIKQLG